MCKFKYCKGPHQCFLRDISPCPGACHEGPQEPANIDAPHRRARRHGFVDRDALAHALLEDRASASIQSVLSIQRVSSKVMRAVEVLGQQSS